MEAIISIVDDDKAVRDALGRMLSAHGFTTAVFESAEKFLGSDQVRTGSCLILDVRMPGMTGIALHDYLVAQNCLIPTILITACPTPGERDRALGSGVFSYMGKPLSEQQLVDTVADALALAVSAPQGTMPGRAAPGV